MRIIPRQFYTEDEVDSLLSTKLSVSDIDDTPVDAETSAPISSNWAYDHENDADPHTQYLERDGTDTMTGDLNLGPGHITSAGSFDIDMQSMGAQTLTIENSADNTAHLHVDGNITLQGTVDGVDIASWIDQDVSSGSTPTFTGTNFTGLPTSAINSGTFVNARISESSVTQHVAAIDHDSLLNFASNEHFLQTAITNVSTALSTGLLKVTTGTGALSTASAGTDYQAVITGAATTIDDADLTASRALISNVSGKVAVSDVTSTELGYLDGSDQDMIRAQWEDTSSGQGSTTFTGHKALYITCYNSSGSTINAGELVVYDDEITPIKNVKKRDAHDELPLGVALETKATANDIKIAVYGFVDVKLYAPDWTDQDGERTAGEKTASQNNNYAMYCSYVYDNYEKAIVDNFFGNSLYTMQGYGHRLGIACSAAGSDYSEGWVRVKLEMSPEAKAPTAPMKFGGMVTLWLEHFREYNEPADNAAIDDWDDLSPWSNDFNAPTASREPAYSRDETGLGRDDEQGAIYFQESAYDNLECDDDDQELHDNSYGLSMCAVHKQDSSSNNNVIISKYDSVSNGRGWYLHADAYLVFDDPSTYSSNGVASYTNSDTTNYLLTIGEWTASSTVKIYEDGVLKDTSSGSITDIGTSSAAELRVGCYRHEQADNYDGHIACILVLRQGLTTAERESLEDYFNEKFELF